MQYLDELQTKVSVIPSVPVGTINFLQIYAWKSSVLAFIGASWVKLLTCGLGGALKQPPVCTSPQAAQNFLTCDYDNY